jgi:hypothetical protein
LRFHVEEAGADAQLIQQGPLVFNPFLIICNLKSKFNCMQESKKQTRGYIS